MPAFDIPANLAFNTYSELVAGINDWLDRADLTGVAQQMISLAERELRRQLQPYFGEKTAAIAVVGGFGALPADCGTIRRLAYRGEPLNQITAFSVEDGPCMPIGYTLEQGGIRVWPAGDYTLAVLYHADLPQLSASNPSTDLLQQHPDLYFYGALMLGGVYLADPDAKSTYGTLYGAALESAKEYMMRQRYSGPLVPRFRMAMP